jgi:hypothetical protein
MLNVNILNFKCHHAMKTIIVEVNGTFFNWWELLYFRGEYCLNFINSTLNSNLNYKNHINILNVSVSIDTLQRGTSKVPCSIHIVYGNKYYSYIHGQGIISITAAV